MTVTGKLIPVYLGDSFSKVLPLNIYNEKSLPTYIFVQTFDHAADEKSVFMKLTSD